jgi:predicted CoA-binding protein
MDEERYRDELDELIERILAEAKTVAVVGLSDDPRRPSHGVARFLKERGYRIIPVNPRLDSVLGEKSYPSLSEIPGQVDLVDVFRRPEEVPPIAREAIRIGARFFWMQEGIESEAGREMLSRAGIPVVMDRCIMKEIAGRRPRGRRAGTP